MDSVGSRVSAFLLFIPSSLTLIRPLWGSYSPCCDNYGSNGSLEPNSHASDGGLGFYQLVWQAVIQPLLPKGLQKTGISNINGPKGVYSVPANRAVVDVADDGST